MACHVIANFDLCFGGRLEAKMRVIANDRMNIAERKMALQRNSLQLRHRKIAKPPLSVLKFFIDAVRLMRERRYVYKGGGRHKEPFFSDEQFKRQNCKGDWREL